MSLSNRYTLARKQHYRAKGRRSQGWKLSLCNVRACPHDRTVSYLYLWILDVDKIFGSKSNRSYSEQVPLNEYLRRSSPKFWLVLKPMRFMPLIWYRITTYSDKVPINVTPPVRVGGFHILTSLAQARDMSPARYDVTAEIIIIRHIESLQKGSRSRISIISLTFQLSRLIETRPGVAKWQ